MYHERKDKQSHKNTTLQTLTNDSNVRENQEYNS